MRASITVFTEFAWLIWFNLNLFEPPCLPKFQMLLPRWAHQDGQKENATVKQDGFLPHMWRNDKESPLAIWLVKFTRFYSSCAIHSLFVSHIWFCSAHSSKRISKRGVEDWWWDWWKSYPEMKRKEKRVLSCGVIYMWSVLSQGWHLTLALQTVFPFFFFYFAATDTGLLFYLLYFVIDWLEYMCLCWCSFHVSGSTYWKNEGW